MPDEPRHSAEQRERWKLKKQRQRAKRRGEPVPPPAPRTKKPKTAKAKKPTLPPMEPPQTPEMRAAYKRSVQAMHDVAAQVRARGIARNRPAHLNPFRLPQFPASAMPKAEVRMAMDDSMSWASGEWAGGFLNGLAAEGLTFLGYPYLAELAQRPEYLTFSQTIATEATREWIKFKGTQVKNRAIEKGATEEQANDEQTEADDKNERIGELTDFLDHLKCRAAYTKLCMHDGQFGRSHLYHEGGTDPDDAAELKTPIGNGRDAVTKSKVGQGWLKRLQVVEPVWCYPTTYNAQNPLSADWYNPQVWYVMGREIHVSRIPRFVSREVPDLLKPAYSFGGLSLTQIAKPYVDIWLRTRQSVGDIIHAFSVMVLSTDLQSYLQTGGADAIARADLFNQFRDNNGLFLLNKATEEFHNVSAPLSGLHELQSQSQEHMMSVARIPAVKFTGIQPQGLNASSDGEMRAFNDTIAAYQQSFIRPGLTHTTDLAQITLWGRRDEELIFEFEPLQQATPKEGAEIRKLEAETDQVRIDSGVVSPEEARAKVAADPDSGYDGIDPEDVPDLLEEEAQGLEPEGGRPQPIAQGEQDDGGGANDAVLPFGADAWSEADHPRGQPGNAGQFGSGGGGGQTLKAPQLGIHGGKMTASHGGTGGWFTPAPKRGNFGEEIDVGGLQKVGAQKGSNPGGVYEDGEGRKFYIKQGKSKAHVVNELVAAALYGLAGTPTLRYRPVKGGGHIATEMAKLDKDNAGKLSKAERQEAARDFAVHAWLGNWDAVGLGGDNLGTVKGAPTALDLGGAMEYRAQGAPKGKAFGNKVGELDTLRDAKMNSDAAGVFGDMTPAEMRESARFVTSLSDDKIRKAVASQGGSESLANKLIARRDDIAEQAKTFGAEGDPASKDGVMVVPAGGKMPVKELNGVKFAPYRPPHDWAAVDGQAEIDEPEFSVPKGKQAASGVVIREPDGRVWMIQPRGGYGGYEGSFPKGRAEQGLSLQANAIKEAYEESGLKVRITGFAGDHPGDMTHTRFYEAVREGGDPSQHDDETEGVVLAPAKKASGFLNRKRDREVLGQDAAWEESKHPRGEGGKFASSPGGGSSGAPSTYEEFEKQIDDMINGGFAHGTKDLAKAHPEWAKKLAQQDPQAAGEMAVAEEVVGKTTFEGKSKKEIIGHLLTQEQGTTTAEILKQTGWPSVSVPQQAAALGLMLEKFKDGGVTKYKAKPMTPEQKLAAKAALELKKKEGTLAPEVEIPKAPPPPPPPPPPKMNVSPPTAQELEKAKKSIALQPQYVPGFGDLKFPDTKKQAEYVIGLFNKKWAGKDGLNPEQLAQKVADFKGLIGSLEVSKSIEKGMAAQQQAAAQAEKNKQAAAALKAQQNASKAKSENYKHYMDSLGISETEATGFDALVNMMGGNGADVIASFKEYESQAAALGYPITGFQYALIRNYINGGYHAINAALRSNSWTTAQHVYARLVNNALDKVPKFTGTVVRGTTLDANELAAYQPGHVVVEKGFTSTGVGYKFSGNVHYTIKANGKRGGDFSTGANTSEKEVLFKAHTFFLVHKVTKKGDVTHIEMEEVEGHG